VWILDRGQTKFDENGKALRMVGFHTDITEQKELETQLIENERVYLDFFENTKSANIIYSTDDEGETFKIKSLNSLVEKLENVKKDEIVGKKIDEVFKGVEEFGLLDIFRDVYKTAKPYKMPISYYSYEDISGWRENYIFKLSNGDIVASYEDRTKEKELEVLLTNTINSVENLIFVKDKEFKYLECNGAFEKFIGHTRDELIGSDDYEFFDKELADFFRVKDIEMFTTETKSESLEWTTFSDGREVYLYTIVSPLRDKSGEIIGLVGNAVDLTAQKKLENELEESQELFKQFMNNIPAAIYITENKTIIYANKNANKFFAKDNIVGCTTDELLSPNEAKNINRGLDIALKKGYFESVMEITNHLGEKEMHREMGFRIQTQKTFKVGLVATNISKEFHLSEELKKEGEKARQLGDVLENSINEIYIFAQSDFKFLYLNQGSKANIGYSLEEMLKMTPLDIKPQMSLELFTEILKPIKEGITDKVHLSTLHKRKDGTTYPVDIYLQPIRYEEVDAYIAIIIDITQRIKIEDELHSQEELMIAQSRHAAMGEMISMIAHQWRQPISVIAMDANNILADIELEILEAKSLKSTSMDIITQTQELSKTIDDFRNFFRSGKDAQEVRIKELFDDALSVIGKSLENNAIELILELDEDKKITTYSRELMQVFINIIKNAKEALTDNKVEDKKITVITSEDKENFKLRICDNAGGVNAEIIDKIFNPYFTTKGEKNGTGLGLYMSKTIIEKHLQGSLTVENNDEGACFEIILPHKINKKD